MQKLSKQEHKIINQKWVIQILFVLYNQKRQSYNSIKKKLDIPNSTLSLRVVELTKYKFLERFVYGSKSKPFYTDYKITKLGLDYLYDIFPKDSI